MTVNNLNITIERKPIKHLHIAVYPPDGRVHISAPEAYTDDQIRLYVLQKWVWITQKRQETTSYIIQADREYVSGENHYFKGNCYRLKVIRQARGAHRVEIVGDYLCLYVQEQTSKENIATLLDGWYRDQLRQLLQPMIEKWERILDVKVNEWLVLQMPSSWGKCHKDPGKIMFNLQLAKKPLGCIEYVVAHELTHLLEPNHTDRFRMILGTYLPEWQKLKNQLNEFPL